MITQKPTNEFPGPMPPDYTPLKILQVEIGQPLPRVDAVDHATGIRYEKGLVLVRLHTQPVTVIEVRLGKQGLEPQEYAAQIWETASKQINAHLHGDGLSEINRLTAAGIPGTEEPRCIAGRAKILRDGTFVSVVVATRDRAHLIAPALDSLLALDYPNFEILVVDNAPSTNATAELIADKYASSGKVRYVREDQPGLAVAHNRALKEINAPIVAFTDDDVLVDRHWLAELVRGFDTAPNVACVTGIVLPAEIETPAQWLVEQYVGLSKGFIPRLFDMVTHRDSSTLYPYSAGWFGTGASMAFKTSALREMGGFAADLGTGTPALGGDDLDAFFRTIVGGYQLVYQPSAILWHFHRREYAGLRKMAYGYGAGLTAFLAKSIKDNPLRLIDVAVRVPIGVYYMLQARSPKVIQRSASFPQELFIQERKGMLYGPIAYLRSYWHHAKLRRKARQPVEKLAHHPDVEGVPSKQEIVP